MAATQLFRCPECQGQYRIDPRDDRVLCPECEDRLANKTDTIKSEEAGMNTSRAPLIMSAVALTASVVALGLTLLSGQSIDMGNGLSEYNFSTPKDALLSQLAIERDQDFRAQMELHSLVNRGKLDEKIRSMTVHRDAEYAGKKLLFVSYQENGIPQHKVIAFEKDANSGLWVERYVSSYAVRSDDERLAQVIESWEANGK